MHIGTLKKLALALTFWLVLHTASLKAQILGPYGTSPITFEVDSNGLLSATGTLTTGSLSLSGAGSRMFWYPGKAAFRAGYVSGSQWDDGNIGTSSVALGGSDKASGASSVAMGNANIASGIDSVAMGNTSTASGTGATAIGLEANATGEGAVAFGWDSQASGQAATAWGGGIASGNNSFAYFGTASGFGSVALGSGTTASGNYSTASGDYTYAQAYDSFVIGQFNVGLSSSGAYANATSWVPTDPLFEIGDGNGGTASNSYTPTYSDAFVVYKNGNAKLHGTLDVAPGGDITMGSYTAGTAP